MDGKHLINIIDFKVIPYRNKKTGAPEEMRLAQCVVTSEKEVDGEKKKLSIVGELMMPKSEANTPAGQYLAEFELSVGQDLRIGSRLTKLHPVNQKPQPAAVATK